ncbi:MAG: ATP-binding protein [Chloroflexia bacterium]|nr:ATP-binding protein [Chloroflexia bacterium]
MRLCGFFTQACISCTEGVMLIEFSVGNYRSFKERVTLSMEAADIASQPPSLDAQNVFAATDNLRLLTSAAIYGANASGKSNLIRALHMMRRLVLTSSRETQLGEHLPVEAYLLSTATHDQASEFEVVFLVNDEQYRYGFTVTPERVVSEWLYRLGSSREVTLFSRSDDRIKVNTRTFREGRNLEDRTRSNALFLSVVAQFNGRTAGSIFQWFGRLGVNTGIHDEADMLQALDQFERSPYGKLMEQLIRRLDVSIEGLQFERTPAVIPSSVPHEVAEQMRVVFDALAKSGHEPENVTIKTHHQRFDPEGRPIDQVTFDLSEHESEGTRRLFALAYPLMRALQEGLVLFVDEIDARIHSNLVIALIRLFNDPGTNPQHAQLIFTTHNTNVLSARLFRRDQIWFVEKTRQGASELYSLVEYRLDGKIVRNDAGFAKDYLAGRYGAVPFIGDLRMLLGAEHGTEGEP